ncbi:hypothetical protein HY632_04430 [Candidatus Uhrbacteria bacterium]|nr:hypothetical protein [Candidatus Uhrbacteria bacterium]
MSLRDRLAQQTTAAQAARENAKTTTSAHSEDRDRADADTLISEITKELDLATQGGFSRCAALWLPNSSFASNERDGISACREHLEQHSFSRTLLRGAPLLIAEYFLGQGLDAHIWFHFVENRARGWSRDYAVLLLGWGSPPLQMIFTRDATENDAYQPSLHYFLGDHSIFVPDRIEYP